MDRLFQGIRKPLRPGGVQVLASLRGAPEWSAYEAVKGKLKLQWALQDTDYAGNAGYSR